MIVASIRNAVVAYRNDVNVAAFLRVIRERESSNDEIAWRMRWTPRGVAYFDSFADHPRIDEPRADGRTSSAAGAFQETRTTYDEYKDKIGADLVPDFSPESQTRIAIGIMAGRGILGHVVAGRFAEAVAVARSTWTSLPGASESSGSWTLDKAHAVYLAYGGQDAPQDRMQDVSTGVTVPDSPTPQPTQTEPTMGALMFLPMILQLVPQLIGLFGKGENATRNANAAQIVVDAFTKAVPGAVNAQDAITKAQADPAVAKAAAAAVLADPVIVSMMAIGPTGIKEARDANLALVSSADKWWKLVLNPVFLVTLITLPLVYIIVWQLVMFMYKVSADVIAQTIGTVIGLVLGGIMGFWMGQTYQQSRQVQQRRDDAPDISIK